MKNQISEDRRQRLDALGFVWDLLEDKWDEGFYHLGVFMKRERHSAVPTRHLEKGYPLGQWVSNQRKRADRVSKDHRQRLDKLGFVWKAR